LIEAGGTRITESERKMPPGSTIAGNATVRSGAPSDAGGGGGVTQVVGALSGLVTNTAQAAGQVMFASQGNVQGAVLMDPAVRRTWVQAGLLTAGAQLVGALSSAGVIQYAMAALTSGGGLVVSCLLSASRARQGRHGLDRIGAELRELIDARHEQVTAKLQDLRDLVVQLDDRMQMQMQMQTQTQMQTQMQTQTQTQTQMGMQTVQPGTAPVMGAPPDAEAGGGTPPAPATGASAGRKRGRGACSQGDAPNASNASKRPTRGA
jgi:hypothetical protein